MHKLIKIDKKQSKIPYLHTTIPVEKSISEIKELLIKYGCERVITDSSKVRIGNKDYPAEMMGFVHKGTRYIIHFPITITFKGRYNEEILDMRISGRIVYNKIKALLVDVEIDYLNFNQAMVQFIAIPTSNGEIVSLAEYVELNQKQIQGGITNFFQIGDGSK